MNNGRIVIEVPAALKALADAFQNVIDLVTGSMNASSERAVDYRRFEAALSDACCGVERAGHGAVLSSLDVDAPWVQIRGKLYYSVDRSVGVYFTMAGEVRVERTLFRESRVHNGKTVDPIALRTGCIGAGWLPRTAQAMAHLMQQAPAVEALKSATQMGRLPYSASSFERVSHELGALYLEERADIEDHLIEAFSIPPDARAISVALDRVSVPLAEPRKRPPGRPRKDGPKRPQTVTYRMAYCGTVTVHDVDGNNLGTVRYGTMPNGDVMHLCGRMAADVQAMIARQPGLKLALLADGAAELWNLLEDHFPESVFGRRYKQVDLWHLLERLAPAAALIHGDAAVKATIHRWKGRLLRTNDAAREIQDELERSGMRLVERQGCRPVHEALTYLENHITLMNYASARRAHLPVGSGNVEATCKTLVTLRMKRAGARWHEETGEHILQLRALALSDRWELAMEKFFEARRTAVRKAG